MKAGVGRSSNPNNDYATDCQQSKSVGDRIQAISTVSTVEVSREDYNDGAGGLDYLITFTGPLFWAPFSPLFSLRGSWSGMALTLHSEYLELLCLSLQLYFG